MPHENEAPDPLKEASLTAIRQVLDSLVDLMFDTGVTVQEFTQLIRGSAVKTASTRLANGGWRVTKSRLAVTTGLSRAEVSRVLRVLNSSNKKIKSRQYPARRILGAWYENPNFLDATGEPSVLPIFGRKKTFETLVKQYGAGLPVRAMLDELTQMNVIEHLSQQRIRVKSRLPITTGLTQVGFRSIGERGSDMLNTLGRNLRNQADPFFEATALVEDAEPGAIAMLRREITVQGTNFASAISALLQRSRIKKTGKSTNTGRGCRLGVTVFYFQEDLADHSSATTKPSRRRNFRRSAGSPVVSTNDD